MPSSSCSCSNFSIAASPNLQFISVPHWALIPAPHLPVDPEQTVLLSRTTVSLIPDFAKL